MSANGREWKNPAVAEHVAVGNTETKGDDIEVREQGAEQAQRPEAQRHLLRRNGLSEGGSDKYMSERRGHKKTYCRRDTTPRVKKMMFVESRSERIPRSLLRG